MSSSSPAGVITDVTDCLRGGSPQFGAEQVTEWTRKTVAAGAAFTWDVPVQRNGLIAQPFLDELKAVGNELRKSARPANPGER